MQLKHQFTEYEHYFFVSLCVLQTCLLFTAATEYAPRSQVVVAGRNVILKCWSDSNGTSQWKHIQGAGDDEASLTINQVISSNDTRITLNTTIDGQYDLHISNADRPNAGFYICITTEKSEVGNGSLVTKRYKSQLAILTSDPDCTLNTNTSNNTLTENDYVQMQCIVRFAGDLVPVVKWRREGQLVDGAKTKTAKSPSGNQITVTTSLSVRVNFMDNGVRYSCDTLFMTNVTNNSSDKYLIKATNTPDYKYSWMSPPINVSYGPQNVAIQVNNMSDNGTIITLGDHLKCYAKGNPIPRFEWTIFAELSNITVQSSDFVLNASMLCNFQLTAECKAMNEFGENTMTLTRNVTSIGQPVNYDIETDSNNPKKFENAIVLVILLLAGILSASIFIVIVRRHFCRSSKGCVRNTTRRATYPHYDESNGEKREEIENDRSLYSVVGDHRIALSSRIASVGLYQNGQVETGNIDNFRASQTYMGSIYEEVKAQESDLAATGGYDDIMQYESVGLAKPQGDIRCTKGSDSNGTKQEMSTPKQNVGADGTIYTEVNTTNGIENLYSSVQKESKSMSFKKSFYAAIDHTSKIVPPPPKL